MKQVLHTVKVVTTAMRELAGNPLKIGKSE
jgi:hypothetical protein